MIMRRTLIACGLLAFAGLAAAKDDDEKKIDGPVIGIDLGTTYSCVGIYKNGRVEIIPNDQGNRITPSYVAFTDDERLIGEAAKNQATINPAQTLFDVKRLIGRRYKDSTVAKDKKLLPFEIVEKSGKPMFSPLLTHPSNSNSNNNGQASSGNGGDEGRPSTMNKV